MRGINLICHLERTGVPSAPALGAMGREAKDLLFAGAFAKLTLQLHFKICHPDPELSRRGRI